ncbi:MAG: L,D-transpeptidase family protein [Candidatus Cyclobacteriaceae bacterium M3_2C_046]
MEQTELQPLEASIYLEHPEVRKEEPLDARIIGLLVKNFLDSMDMDQNLSGDYHKQYRYQELKEFYKQNQYLLGWNSLSETNDYGYMLMEALKTSSYEGLEPNDYDLPDIMNLQQEVFSQGEIVNLKDLLQLDILMSSAYINYAEDLSVGRMKPDKIDTAWFVNPNLPDLSEHLYQALNSNNLKENLMELNPDHPDYLLLKKYLKQYRRIAEKGGWPRVYLTETLEQGDSSQAIADIKQRLMFTNDLDSSAQPDPIFTAELNSAIRRFQSRMGQKIDGKIGSNTVEALNIPVEERIRKIELNLERLRWFDDFSDRYILVNVPEFSLKVFEQDQVKMQMKVVVGREYDSTPIFSEKMEYLVFSPHWTVPYSIASEEMLPRIRKNPGYLPEHNYLIYNGWGENAPEVDPYEVDWSDIDKDNFPFKVVQQSGSFNALGAVKFMFPNNLSIYIHDTPSEYLFDRIDRDYSHGCIRIDKPVELARYLLQDKPEWDLQKIHEFMNKSEPVEVYLSEPIPVHIMYKTVYVDEKGLLHFEEDIYGHDTAHLKAILANERRL